MDQTGSQQSQTSNQQDATADQLINIEDCKRPSKGQFKTTINEVDETIFAHSLNETNSEYLRLKEVEK
ncbi:hypothetical protein FGO68_gene13033 [Halteria grandinella]|uniref:Uncharacterized protein n=1 Tax=Halteria grandinella TaxID=5974 RepID=A0A8J8NY66_HALGN|nr:hypothetical protein FGO68_gene13033 [Halteria grandinella]